MPFAKTFSALVVGVFIAGVVFVAVSAMVGSEFLRRLGLFPILFALFLLPHVLGEREASRAVRWGHPPTDDGARVGPQAAAAGAVTGVRP